MLRLRLHPIAAGALLLLGLSLAGCATGPAPRGFAPVDSAEEVDRSDPLWRWVPHIREASKRFDVPEQWIRAVMVQESGGRAEVNGKVITSPKGAIGLMQVMPATYEGLREQYALGPDPSDPRDNILAGTAYLREMYDLFGAPGFLAAYNCGPQCLTLIRKGKQRMPRETRKYLAAVTPQLAGAQPEEPSAAVGRDFVEVVEVAVLPPQRTRGETVKTIARNMPVRERPVAVASLARRAPGRNAPVAVASEPAGKPSTVVASAPSRKPTAAKPVHPSPRQVAEAPVPNGKPVRPARSASRDTQPSKACGPRKNRVCVAQAGGPS